MTKTTEMEVIKVLHSDSFWAAILVPICAALFLKLIGLTWALIKWVFKDYSQVRADINRLRVDMAEMKIALEKIGKKLGTLKN